METQEVTYYVKLNAVQSDPLGYINYVFERLNYTGDPDYQYIMCVRFPNWNQVAMEIGDIGYVTVKYVVKGVDKWFDGKDFVLYKDTNIIFLKFIHEKKKVVLDSILID